MSVSFFSKVIFTNFFNLCIHTNPYNRWLQFSSILIFYFLINLSKFINSIINLLLNFQLTPYSLVLSFYYCANHPFLYPGIQREEEKVKKSLKMAAKTNNKEVCLVLARELINSKNSIKRLNNAKAHIKSVELSMQQQAGQFCDQYLFIQYN